MATVDGGITLDQAQEQLGLAIAALAAARQQQTFAVTSPSGGRSTAKPLHESLLKDVQFWRQEVARLQRGSRGPTVMLGVSCG
jgi:hypothetical protein